jgi:hypothetical protein
MLVRDKCKHYEETYYGSVKRCSSCIIEFSYAQYPLNLIDIVSESPLSHSYIKMNSYAKERIERFYGYCL